MRKLRAKIVEVFGTCREFAKALNITESTLSKKLNGINEFRVSEIKKCVDLLGIKPTEIFDYFN